MNRINSNINLGAKIEPGIDPVNAKLKFWEDLIYKLECDSNNRGIMIEHPVSILLADCLRQNYNINLRYLSTFLNTKKNSLNNQVPNNIESLCSYGEGTYSQLNYALQGLLLSETISPSCIKLLENSIFLKNLITDIAAHIGQSMSIATTLIRLKYFANKKNSIYLPIDLMLKKNLSQEQLLKIFQGYIDKDSKEFINISNSLSDLVFEMATVANDHLLTARSKFSKVKQEIQTILKDNSNDAYLLSCSDKWLQGVPDAIYIPFMSAIPLQIYLGKLETHNFDIINNNLETKEWRLAWKSYWNYNKRLF
ncbi:hypothetical protein PACTADRAFT_48864 [Pachysolen tannophilus NRRL Y-2460]|uniref:Uncharacterized protein n=1 Tax=Pachysolen tannophilus NRRL Y-2460 TaxID=669874 RepID=A0A1E4TZD9_PACTA|nr:hypothetical protein PACTADRAFT_48864 [Pachysolen tannophilus NRRL Y-2460]